MSDFSIEWVTQPFTDLLAEVDLARDKGTRAGLQATGRLVAKKARGAAPKYSGPDPRATAESGQLRKGIKASRVKKLGQEDYSSTVSPNGPVTREGKEARGVPLYRGKIEEKYGYMKAGIAAADGDGAKANYEAAYDKAFARFR